MMEGSLLDVLGQEIIGIVSPVSICMFLVVLLVKTLQTEVSETVLSSVANLVYSEDDTDSDWTKLLGALINAGVFVVVVTLVTFVLVALFYFRCTKCIRVYMSISAFTVLAYMGGSVSILLVQKFAIPIDAITASIILYNFAVVGVLSVFICKVPILVTQGYLVIVGMLVAFWFTSLPEWTTWVLLVAISLYDIFAVLTPGGPLNLLVQLAMTRDEEIPALIYEARPVLSARDSGQVMVPTNGRNGASQQNQATTRTGEQRKLWKRSWGSRDTTNERSSLFGRVISSLRVPLLRNEEHHHDDATSVSMQSLLNSNGDAISHSEEFNTVTTAPIQEEIQSNGTGQNMNLDLAVSRLTNATDVMLSLPYEAILHSPRNDNDVDDNDDDEGFGLGASGAIKLGLGDFIFYSVLVGRAALYDMTTVYACYLAIITGLATTLGLLAVWRRALPALPISIALGILFYFLTRLLMEPFVMQYGTSLLLF